MKTLLILRHAKASGNSPSGEDRDRPLNERGEKDAKTMGKALRKLEVPPNAILASPAERARRTAEIVADQCRFRGEIGWRESLYLAETAALLDAIREPTDADRLLLVAHNPGLEHLVNHLVAAPAGGVHLCTSALARIDFDIGQWIEVGKNPGTLVWLLDPEVVQSL